MHGPLKDSSRIGDCKDEEVHAEMMKIILRDFAKRGFTNMRANFEGMPMPEKIDKFTPDITCNRNDSHQVSLILEVETYETITQPQSEHKWKKFYEKSRRIDGEFHLAVPKFCNGNSGRAFTSQKLEEFGIKAGYIWEVNGYLQQSLPWISRPRI